MISVEKALQIISQVATSTPKSESILSNVVDINKGVVTENVYSKINIPDKPTSTRDGFGWNSQTPSTSRKFIGDTFAGSSLDIKDITGVSKHQEGTEPSTTEYIATGGVVDTSCFDCVVMFEDCAYIDHETQTVKKLDSNSIKSLPFGSEIQFLGTTKPGHYIRQVGCDVSEGELICSKNQTLTAERIGLLASIGEFKSKQVKVGLLSTGDEIGLQVNDANKPMLQAYFQENKDIFSQVELIDMGVARDTETHLIKKIESFSVLSDSQESCPSFIISSGGASVGKKDFTLSTLQQLGFEIHITKVNMMPGKPFIFATHKAKGLVYFGLAGNPVSCGVGFNLYVKPFFEQYLKLKTGPYSFNTVKARSTFQAKSTEPSRPEYHRVKLGFDERNGDLVVKSTGQQLSSTIKSLADADGMIVLDKEIQLDDLVDVILLRDLPSPSDIYVRDLLSQSEILLSEKNNQQSQQLIEVKKVQTTVSKCRIGILTCSDRAYKGIYEDLSGAALKKYCEDKFCQGFEIEYLCVPDEIEDIKKAILYFLDQGCGLILTTGGTGPAVRDVIPRVMKDMLHKELPGFGESMRRVSLQYVPTAILSAQTAGIIYQGTSGALVINCPGSPKSIPECLDAIIGAIPYGVELCNGGFIETKDKPAFRGKRTN